MGKTQQYYQKKELIKNNKKYLKAGKKIITKNLTQKKALNISVILITSIYIKDKNYYPQVFLGKYKYVVRKKKCWSFLLTTQKLVLMILMILIKQLRWKKLNV